MLNQPSLIAPLRTRKRKQVGQFFLNWNARGQLCSKYGNQTIFKYIAKLLGYTKSEILLFSSHSYRRTAGTTSANCGATEVDLCRAGRWKNPKTARRYVDNSKLFTRVAAERLHGTNPSNSNFTAIPLPRNVGSLPKVNGESNPVPAVGTNFNFYNCRVMFAGSPPGEHFETNAITCSFVFAINFESKRDIEQSSFFFCTNIRGHAVIFFFDLQRVAIV